MPSIKKRSLKIKSAGQLQTSPDGRYLVATKVQGRISVYDLEERVQIADFKPFKNTDELLLSPCGKMLSVTCNGDRWFVVDPLTGKIIQQSQEKLYNIGHSRLQFTANGQSVFIASEDTAWIESESRWESRPFIRQWSLENGCLEGIRETPFVFRVGYIYHNKLDSNYIFVSSEYNTSRIHLITDDVLKSPFIEVLPPDQFLAPPEREANGCLLEGKRWSSIRDFTISEDCNIATLILGSYKRRKIANLSLDSLKVIRSQELEEGFEANCCDTSKEIIAVAGYKGQMSENLGRIHFFARDDLRPLGVFNFPKIVHDISLHRSGIGIGIAASNQSIYYFDMLQTCDGVQAWIDQNSYLP